MDFSSGLALKIIGGLGVASVGSVGIYFIHDHYQNPLTRFDSGLIEYIGKSNNDIVFKVTQGSGSDTSTTLTNFPDFSNNPVKITVRVEASGTNNNLAGNDTEGKAELQKLNQEEGATGDGTAWNWICEMEFTRDEDSKTVSSVEDSQKNRLLKATNEGLLGKLQKNVSSESDENTKQSIKKLKIDFIKKCAYARTKEENKKINSKPLKALAGNKIETKEKIKFELAKGGNDKSWGSSESHLYFKDKSKFDYWFPR